MGRENHPAFRITPTVTASTVEAVFENHAIRMSDTDGDRCQCGTHLSDATDHLTHIRAELMSQETILLPGERLLYPLSVAIGLMHRILSTTNSNEWAEAAEGTGLEVACAFLTKMDRIFLYDGFPSAGIPVPDPHSGHLSFRCLDDPALVTSMATTLSQHKCVELGINANRKCVFTCSCGFECVGDRNFEYHRFTRAAARGVIFGKAAEMSRTAETLSKIGVALRRSNFFEDHETATLALTASGLAHLLGAVDQEKRSF